jgi:RES domain-containing protein
MIVYRLQKDRHGPVLSGIGAARRGARWNSPGIEIIYTSINRSLSMAELVVHLPLGILPSGFFNFEIFIPDSISIGIIDEKKLPSNWNTNPPVITTQKTGDDFVRRKQYCLLKVPSAVTKGDFNILINPAHHEFTAIKVVNKEPFPFDRRLFDAR